MSIEVVDDLNLLDSEVQEILKIASTLSAKYSLRRGTYENLVSLQNEAMDLYEQAGFLVTVSILGDGPEITIQGRADEKFEFDPERQQWEVKKEVADDAQVKQFLHQGGTTDTKAEAINPSIGEKEFEPED